MALAAVLVLGACESGGKSGPPSISVVPVPTKVAERWEPVARFAGAGNQKIAAFAIAPNAIEWRVTASCAGEALSVSLASEPKPLVAPRCPGRGFGFSIRTGPAVLEVAATGDWELVVEQKVDTPISEPPLAGMTDDARVAKGAFYGIDQSGSGTAALYRLADGRLALRLDPFQVTPNTDLFVWLSAAQEPRTSKDAFTSDHVQLDALKATAGAQNYLVPDGVPAGRMRSVVVWCEPVRTAYAAAALAH